jgi:hypothetical protein
VLHVEHAVDTEAHDELLFLRLDVDVGRAHLARVFEHRLEQLDHRRVFDAGSRREGAEVAGDVRHRHPELLHEARDLVGAAVDPVDGREELRLGDHCHFDLALEQPRDLVVGVEVGGVGHAHEHVLVAVLEEHGTETTSLDLGELLRDLGLQPIRLEVDVRHVELGGERRGEAVLGHVALVDQNAAEPAHPAELAAGVLLLVERALKLLCGQQALFDENLAEPDFLGTGHGLSKSFPVDRVQRQRRGAGHACWTRQSRFGEPPSGNGIGHRCLDSRRASV